MTVRLHLPLCCGRTSTKDNEEKGSYALRFYRWFLECFRSCLLLLVALPGLIDTLTQLLARKPLLWLYMTGQRRYLTQSHFLSTASQAWSLKLHLLFGSVRRSLYGGRKFTYTHRKPVKVWLTFANYFESKTKFDSFMSISRNIFCKLIFFIIQCPGKLIDALKSNNLFLLG